MGESRYEAPRMELDRHPTAAMCSPAEHRRGREAVGRCPRAPVCASLAATDEPICEMSVNTRGRALMRFSGIQFVCITLCLLLPSVSLALDGNGKNDVVIDFGPAHGIWVPLNNSRWLQLHLLSPESMVTGDVDGN